MHDSLRELLPVRGQNSININEVFVENLPVEVTRKVINLTNSLYM